MVVSAFWSGSRRVKATREWSSMAGWPRCREKASQPLNLGAPGASHLGTWESTGIISPNFPANSHVKTLDAPKST